MKMAFIERVMGDRLVQKNSRLYQFKIILPCFDHDDGERFKDKLINHSRFFVFGQDVTFSDDDSKITFNTFDSTFFMYTDLDELVRVGWVDDQFEVVCYIKRIDSELMPLINKLLPKMEL